MDNISLYTRPSTTLQSIKKYLPHFLIAGIVMFFITCLTLNYFDILHLDFLSFLPKGRGVIFVKDNNGGRYIRPEFSYDSKQATTSLTEYLHQQLQPNYIPQKLDVEQNFLVSSKSAQVKSNFFGGFWTSNNTLIHATFFYNLLSNTPQKILITFQPQLIKDNTPVIKPIVNSDITETLANDYAHLFIRTPILVSWQCKTDNRQTLATYTYCERSTTTTQGILYQILSNRHRTLEFDSCFIYDKNTSPQQIATLCYTGTKAPN